MKRYLRFFLTLHLCLLTSCVQYFKVEILSPKDGDSVRKEYIDISGSFKLSDEASIKDISIKVGQKSAVLSSDGKFIVEDYRLEEGEQSIIAKLFYKRNVVISDSIKVNRLGENNPPTVGQNQNFMIDEDLALEFFLNSGEDSDGDELTYHLVKEPKFGQISKCLNGSTSLSCSYKPNLNYFGEDKIEYLVRDGQSESLKIAEIIIDIIPVNDPPIVGEAQHFSIDEGQTLTFSLNPGRDVEEDHLVYELITGPNNARITGCLDNSPKLSCELIPDEYFSGKIEFSYRIFDGVSYSSSNGNVTVVVKNTVPDDTTAPLLTIDPPDGSLVRVNSPLFTIKYSDENSGVDLESLEVIVDGDTVDGRLVIDQNKALLQFNDTWPLSNGNHTIYVKVSDKFGNETELTNSYIVSNSKIENAYITGRVVDQDGVPLAGALLSDQQSPLGVELSGVTDENGEFKLSFTDSGKYFLRATAEGFVDGARFIDVIAGRDGDLGDIILATADPVKTPISANTGGTAQNSTGTVSANIVPGAIERDVEVSVTEFSVGNSLPGPLPELSAFTYAFDPQPRGLDYNSSQGGFTLQNSLGFNAGSKLVFGYYDESIGRWLDSGYDVIVGGDNKIDLAGMSLPPNYRPVDVNQPSICVKGCVPPTVGPSAPPPPPGPLCPGCIINIFTGDLAVEHDLPSVKRFNKDFSLSFIYASTAAKPNFFVQAGLVNGFPEPADSVEGKISLGSNTINVELGGEAVQGESLIRLLVDAKNADGEFLPTGTYAYTAELSTLYKDSEYATATYFGAPPGLPMGVITRVPLRFRSQLNGRVPVVNRRNSPFGVGWSLRGLESLHVDPEGTILLDEGGIGTTFFTPLSPSHSTSKLQEFGLSNKLSSKSNLLTRQPQITSLISKNGFIFASDCSNNAIYRINFDGSFDVVAGNGKRGFSGDFGLAINASLNCPRSVYPAERGGFYIADSGNKRIRKVSRLGVITTIAGDGSNNEGQDGALAQMSGIGTPMSVSEDKMRAVFFTVGDRIRMVNPRGKLETYSGPNEGYVPVELDRPSQVLFDEFDYPIYVDKNNNRILSVHPQGDSASVLLGEENINGKSVNLSDISKPVSLTFDSVLKRYFILDAAGDTYVWAGKGSKKVKSLVINSNGLLKEKTNEKMEKSKISIKAQVYVEGLGLVLSDGKEIFLPQKALNIEVKDRNEVVGSYVGEKSEYRELYRMGDGSFRLVDIHGNASVFNNDGKLQAKKTPEGQNTYYYYNHFGAIDRIVLPSSDYFKFNYDGRGFLSRIIDPSGRVSKFNVSAQGKLLKITNPDETFKAYAYDEDDLLSMERDEAGLESFFEYEYSRVVKETRSDGTVRNINPEMLQGLVGYIDKKSRNEKILAPIVRPEDIKVSIESKSGSCSTESTYRDGNSLQSVTDCLGRETSFNTDDNGNITSKSTPAGRVYAYTHDSKGRILTSNDERGVTKYFYDEITGKVVKIVDENKSEMNFTYYSSGKLHTVTDFDGVLTTFEYNQFWNLTRVKDHFGNIIQELQYGPGQNMTYSSNASGLASNYTRNSQGEVVLIQENSGADTRFSFDPMGRLISIEDALSGETSFTYRGDGEVSSITDARGATTSYSFHESLALLTETLNAIGQAEILEHNEEELVSRVIQKDGSEIVYEYDLMQNLTQKQTSDDLVQNFYDEDDVLVETRDSDSYVFWNYGSGNGSLLTSTNQSNLPDEQIEFSYYDDGKRRSIFFEVNTDDNTPTQLNYQVNYNYTRGGKVKELYANLFGVPITWIASFDEKMRIDSTLINEIVQTNFEYDLMDRYIGIQNKTSANLLVSEFDYEYSIAGNIIKWSQQTELGSGVLSLTYDKLNRITSSSGGESFDYDILGNRTGYNERYNLINQLIEDQEFTYAYTINGNLESKKHKYSGDQTKYYWSVENKLKRVEKIGPTNEVTLEVSYKYDSLGRRIERAVNNLKEPEKSYVRKFIFDDEDIIAEFNGENRPVAAYLHGEGFDNPLAMVRDLNDDGEFTANEIFYFTKDHLGSVRELVNFEGKVVQRYRYSVYGQTTIEDHDQNPFNRLVENRYAYTSRELEEETGDYFYRARYYSPDTGRFLSEDPIGVSSGDFNFYRYVENNPLRFKDPSGKDSRIIYLCIAVVGAYIAYKHKDELIDYTEKLLDKMFPNANASEKTEGEANGNNGNGSGGNNGGPPGEVCPGKKPKKCNKSGSR